METGRLEILYWFLVMVVILLSGPLTWVMNTVWLLPSIVLVSSEYRYIGDKIDSVSLSMILVGFVLSGIPDTQSFPLLIPFATRFVAHKYVVAELIIFLSMLVYLHSQLKRGYATPTEAVRY